MNHNPRRTVRSRIIAWLTPVRIAGLVIGTVGAAVSVFGIFYKGPFLYDVVQAFYANLGTECVSIAVTIILIDWLYEMRDEKRDKEHLVREMRSPDHGIAMGAVEELRAQGWLDDRGLLSKKYLWDANLKGVNLAGIDLHGAYFNRADLSGANLDLCDLYGAHLMHANLEGAHLDKANLEHADLHNAVLKRARLVKANLRNAHLHDVNFEDADLEESDMTGAQVQDATLTAVHRLRGAVMADARLYNGKYNLAGDRETAAREGISPDDEDGMARFYGVSLDAYRSGRSGQ